MNVSRLCPVCETPLPDDSPRGLCPQCLMSEALGEQSAGSKDPTGDSSPAILGSPHSTRPKLRTFGDYELLGEVDARGDAWLG